MALPPVIATPGRPFPRRLRFAVLERDGFRCVYCGRRSPQVQLDVAHLVARVAGGATDPSNIVTACSACNGALGTRTVVPPAVLEPPAGPCAPDAHWPLLLAVPRATGTVLLCPRCLTEQSPVLVPAS